MNQNASHDHRPDSSISGPPPVPPRVISYATPASLAQPGYLCWRRGDRVIVPSSGAPLPPVCFKCGQATHRYTPHRFVWHHPALYLLILPGILIYAIVALCVQQKATVYIPVCDAHHRRRRNWVIFAWLLALAGIAAGVAGCSGLGSRRTEIQAIFGLFGGLILLVLAAIIGIYGGRIAYAKEIGAGWAQLGGAGEGFLGQLPWA